MRHTSRLVLFCLGAGLLTGCPREPVAVAPTSAQSQSSSTLASTNQATSAQVGVALQEALRGDVGFEGMGMRGNMGETPRQEGELAKLGSGNILPQTLSTVILPKELGSDFKIRGSYDANLLQQIFSRNRAALVLCYERAHDKTPILAGTVQLSFAIQKDGSVSSAKVGSKLSTELGDCLVQHLTTMHFPPPSQSNTVEILYPIVFQEK